MFTFDASWGDVPGKHPQVSGMTPEFSGGVNYALTLQNFTAYIDWVMVIGTPDAANSSTLTCDVRR
jgi:hypothetical protein